MVHAGVLRVVVPVPPQRRPRRRGLRRARLPLHLAPAPRPLRSRVARPARRQGRRGCCCPTSGAAPRARAARRSASGTSSRTRARRAGRARRPRGHDPRDDRARRRSARRLRARARRRHGPGAQPERRPARRSRRRCRRSARSTRSFVQFSGAIWYPIVVRLPARARRTRLAREKRVNQMARARQYIEWVEAAHVFPCAGPPCFLDDDLVRAQRPRRRPAQHLPRPDGVPRRARAPRASTARTCIVPGSVIDARRRRVHGHASGRATPTRRGRSPTRRRTSTSTERDWAGWLAAERASWSPGRRDLVAELAAWFEPLLERAPITSAGIAGNVVLDVGDATRSASTSSSRTCGRGAASRTSTRSTSTGA